MSDSSASSFDPHQFFVVHSALMDIQDAGRLTVAVYDIAVTHGEAKNAQGDGICGQLVTTHEHVTKFGPPREGTHIADLEVYWCPYEKDAVRYTVLEKGKDSPGIMLTPTMDGCSFGIGHTASDGTCLVAHANKASVQKEPGDLGEMPSVQKAMLKAEFGTQKQELKYTVGPKAYRMAEDDGDLRPIKNASLFGVRGKDGHWRFHRHGYVEGMGEYIHYETESISKSKDEG